MIKNRADAVMFEKFNKELYDEAAAKHKKALDHFNETNYRSVFALRVGTQMEENFIHDWLIKNSEGRDKLLSFGKLVRIVFFRLGIIKDEHLSVMFRNKYKMDFLDVFNDDFKRSEEMIVNGVTIFPFEESKHFYEQYKEPGYKNITAVLDPFLKDLWTDYISKKNKSGMYIFKKELMRMGVYPEAYFSSVVSKNTKNRTHKKEKVEKSEDSDIQFGLSVTGDEAQKINALKNMLAVRKITIADIIRFELVRQKYVSVDEFKRYGRVSKKITDNIAEAIKRESFNLSFENEQQYYLYALNFKNDVGNKLRVLIEERGVGSKDFFFGILRDGGFNI